MHNHLTVYLIGLTLVGMLLLNYSHKGAYKPLALLCSIFLQRTNRWAIRLSMRRTLPGWRANRIGRESGGILRYDVKFLNVSLILPSSGLFFYYGKHIMLKLMVDSSELCDRLRNQVNGMG